MREHKATYADRPAEKRFRMIRIPMSVEMFHQLPPNGAYKYEYADGQTLISPQPHACELYLELDSFTAPERESYERWSVRQLAEDDWDELPNVAAAAFNRVAPYATFGDREIKEVMAEELQVTRSGDDGELVREACMVAEEPWGEDLRVAGAALVTLRKGQTNGGEIVPWMTWIFVGPLFSRHGIAGGLLARVVEKLKAAGHQRLESTICAGNHASAMWHWHRGFKMGPSLHERLRRRG